MGLQTTATQQTDDKKAACRHDSMKAYYHNEQEHVKERGQAIVTLTHHEAAMLQNTCRAG
jgi:hypothetical protein